MSEKSKFDLVFPEGHPKHRPMMMGKHSVGHWTTWRDAIAKAERLDPWLSDFLTWTLWWETLNRERDDWLMNDLREQLAEAAAKAAP